MDPSSASDIIEIQQLLAHYAVNMTKDDVDTAIEVFAPDATFSSFGHTRGLADFVLSTKNAPKGIFITGPAAITVDGDEASGEQPMSFVDQSTHDMLLGWYTDTFRRTGDGWRVQSRQLTFLRRSGSRDAGEPTNTVTGEPLS
ncbi:MAG TPA: nuclear transport factor 2 family protein [Acidimicrobiales bacterium]